MFIEELVMPGEGAVGAARSRVARSAVVCSAARKEVSAMPVHRWENGRLVEEPRRRRRGRRVRGAPDVPTPPSATVHAREPLTVHSLADRVGLDADSAELSTAERLIARERRGSREHAQLLREIAALWVESDDDVRPDDREQADLLVGIALRTTTSKAGTLLRDAHIALHELPRVFARLESGDLPVEWFERVLRTVREFTPTQRTQVDEQVAEWDLASIPVARFRRELRLLAAWLVREGEGVPRPEDLRDVSLERSMVDDGTACLRITGPVPEIHALTQRLDAGARAVQNAQRHALADGAPIPFDIDGEAARTGRPMSLADLRYAIMTRSVLETGGIEAPAPRFRMNVTVPVMTLLGKSEAPAQLDGITPIPAAMARILAGDEPVWYRVLTDPISGEFLPAEATPYRPAKGMLEHLRLKDPVCAVPGCTRTTRDVSEADHIQEYNHTNPANGGPTTVENLHLLCFTHHRLKTDGLIDPVRTADGETHWALRGSRVRVSASPNRDLLTPVMADALQQSWEEYRTDLEMAALIRLGVLDEPDGDSESGYPPPPF